MILTIDKQEVIGYLELGNLRDEVYYSKDPKSTIQN